MQAIVIASSMPIEMSENDAMITLPMISHTIKSYVLYRLFRQ